MSLKNPVTPPGIDPGTVRLVAQRLNHYAIPGLIYIYIIVLPNINIYVYKVKQSRYRPGVVQRVPGS